MNDSHERSSSHDEPPLASQRVTLDNDMIEATAAFIDSLPPIIKRAPSDALKDRRLKASVQKRRAEYGDAELGTLITAFWESRGLTEKISGRTIARALTAPTKAKSS